MRLPPRTNLREMWGAHGDSPSLLSSWISHAHDKRCSVFLRSSSGVFKRQFSRKASAERPSELSLILGVLPMHSGSHQFASVAVCATSFTAATANAVPEAYDAGFDVVEPGWGCTGILQQRDARLMAY